MSRRPLDKIFQAQTHVAILRILCCHTLGISRRAAARATRLSDSRYIV